MEKKLHLRYSQTDYKGNWRMGDIFTQLAELATAHAQSFGAWNPELKDAYGWVIAKMRVKIYTPLKIDEEVTIRTWVSEGTRVIYPRHFEFTNTQGEIIGEATTQWTLIDLIHRRIVMPKRVGLVFPPNLPKTGNIEIEADFFDEEGFEFVENRQVRYGDLDVNGHLNNARYVEWMCDVLGYEAFKDHYIGDLSIQFKKETAPNEWLSLEKKVDGDCFKVRGIRDGQVHFIAEGLWKKY